MTSNTIPVAECRRLLDSGQLLNILDVRTPGEFSRVRVSGARLMPLDQLDPAAVAALRLDQREPVYVMCQSGGRASQASQFLQNAGLASVYTIEGGMAAWQRMGLPVERNGGNVISMERQVRVGAGLLVLLGTALAWIVHPAFLLLPALVGAGLVFAGVSDYCGMALLLGKLPWNRKGLADSKKGG